MAVKKSQIEKALAKTAAEEQRATVTELEKSFDGAIREDYDGEPLELTLQDDEIPLPAPVKKELIKRYKAAGWKLQFLRGDRNARFS
jgi:phosphoglycolate phosphatase-like HAD superfamily hydrolase